MDIKLYKRSAKAEKLNKYSEDVFPEKIYAERSNLF